MVTVRILRMFGRMSVLEHVTIRGGLIMTIQDRVCTDDPSSRVKRWEDECFFRSTRVKMVGLSVSWDWVLKEGPRGTTRALSSKKFFVNCGEDHLDVLYDEGRDEVGLEK